MLKKILPVLVITTLLCKASLAQLASLCYNEPFAANTTGWGLSSGCKITNYNNPLKGCQVDYGIATPGVGGNNPGVITTPAYISNGSTNISVKFDVFVFDGNLNCSSSKDFPCPTSIDITVIANGVRTPTTIVDYLMPSVGPGKSPEFFIFFPIGNLLPAGTPYQIELAFKQKSGTGACNQPSTKYVFDNLNINNTGASVVNKTICSDLLPYTWNGLTFTESGSQTAKLVSYLGCDSLSTLNLTVNNTSSSTTNLSLCSGELPYEWNGLIFTAAGSKTYHTTNAVGCDSAATLNLSIKPAPESITDVTICSSELPYEWNGKSYTASGNYKEFFVVGKVCDSVARLNLTVLNTTSSSEDVVICSTQAPYSWNGADYSESGTYTAKFTNAAGCDSTATLNLTVNATSSGSEDVVICSTQAPYQWNGGSFSESGSYTATLTNAAGCDSIATLNLTVNATSSGSEDVVICSTQAPYQWNGGSYSESGSYNATLTNAAGCDSIATLNLTVNATSSGSEDVVICSTQAPYQWNGVSYSESGSYNATLTNAAGCDSIATLNLTVNATSSGSEDVVICSTQAPYQWNGESYSESGSYTATLTNAAGCDSIATLNLTVNATSSGSEDVTICANEVPYQWNGESYSESGSYTATLTNAAGCDSIATLNLTINNCATDDIFCDQVEPTNEISGNLATNDHIYAGADVTYSLLSGPFVFGSSDQGGANVTVNADGTFTIVRTDEAQSSFTFTYRITDNKTQAVSDASVRVCFPEGGSLPVTMLSFNATRKNREVVLNWKTSTEVNAKHFEVLRKTNAGFVVVGKVSANNSANGSSYEFTDNENTFKGSTQYRIRAVDIINQSKYSVIKTVKGFAASATEFSIYPNPAINGTANVHIADASQKLNLQVIDQNGRALKSINTNGSSLIQINGLSRGVYFLKAVDKTTNEVSTQRLIVQ